MVRIDYRVYEAGHCSHPECATRSGAPLAPSRFPALAFALRHPAQGMMLFDTGYSEHFFAGTANMPERLYRAVTPVSLGEGRSLQAQLQSDWPDEPVRSVMLSHLHGDHVGGLLDFPRVPLFCAREAWEDMRGRSRFGALRKGLLPALLPHDFLQRVTWIEDLPAIRLEGPLAPFARGHDLLGDGSLLAVALPGHAAGHYGLLFLDAADVTTFLVADAAWSTQAIRDAAPPPAVVTAWLGNTRSYRETLARLHALSKQAPSIRLLPSHCREASAS